MIEGELGQAISNLNVPQCDHFQQVYNMCIVKVHVPIIRQSHCVFPIMMSFNFYLLPFCHTYNFVITQYNHLIIGTCTVTL